MIKITFNNIEMTLLSKAFLDNLFPKPFENELLVDKVYIERNKEICDFYFTINYYNQLKNHIRNEFNEGKFSKSNSYQQWMNLMNKFDDFSIIDEIPNNLRIYWLSKSNKNQSINNSKIEDNLSNDEIEYIKIPEKYYDVYTELNSIFNDTKLLFLESVFDLFCNENNKIYNFQTRFYSDITYQGIVKNNNKLYLIDALKKEYQLDFSNTYSKNNILHDPEFIDHINREYIQYKINTKA